MTRVIITGTIIITIIAFIIISITGGKIIVRKAFEFYPEDKESMQFDTTENTCFCSFSMQLPFISARIQSLEQENKGGVTTSCFIVVK